jgi:hypothetical protein
MASLQDFIRELSEADLSLTELKNGAYIIKQELPELCEPALSEANLWLCAYKQVVQDTLDTCEEAIADEETGRIEAELLRHQRDTLQQALDEMRADLPEDDDASVASSVPWNEWCPASSAADAAMKARDLHRELVWMFQNSDFCQPGIWETYRSLEQELDTMKRWQAKLEWREEQYKEDEEQEESVLRADLARARRDYHVLLMDSELEAPGVSRALDNLKDTIEDLEREIDYRESSCSCCAH